MKRNGVLTIILALALILSGCGSADSSYMVEGDTTAGADYDEMPAEEQPAAEGGYYDWYDEAEAADDAGEETASSPSESYLVIDENREAYTDQDSLVTFSLKVDTAAYTNVARYLESGLLPPADAVRTEELVNYFSYDGDMRFTGGHPFAIATEVGPSPLDSGKHMAYIRVKTPDVEKGQLPSSNLTFLIDTSGSMNTHDKLPLLKEAFGMLVDTLDGDDVVSIVTYAGSSSIVLDSVTGDNKAQILGAIQNLDAGGSTAGAEGIHTAYALAQKNYMSGGNNRVILATDGDFNVGISSVGELEEFISDKRDSGLYLSVLGFGTGNIRDDIMETLAANGNGNYNYINNSSTAKKVLVDELGSNLFTVADDVKAQVEFNPANVKSYRLIGYENRRMRNEDFTDDTKDAGEIGAGTDVVILFELELQNAAADPDLKYAESSDDVVPGDTGAPYSDELLEVRIRYKEPGGSESTQATLPVTVGQIASQGSTDFGFACSVAAFGHLLRDSQYARGVTVDDILAQAEENLGSDQLGYRSQFLELVERYGQLVGW